MTDQTKRSLLKLASFGSIAAAALLAGCGKQEAEAPAPAPAPVTEAPAASEPAFR